MSKNFTFEWNPGRFTRAVARQIRKDLVEIGALAVADIRRQMTSGVSSPGQVPGVDTGNLKENLMFEVDPSDFRVRIGVADGVPYDLALEFGYQPTGLQPRPYLRPQLPKMEKQGIRRAKKIGRRVRKDG